jgi:hypothetical protein
MDLQFPINFSLVWLGLAGTLPSSTQDCEAFGTHIWRVLGSSDAFGC